MKTPNETAAGGVNPGAVLAPVQLIKVADIAPDPKNQKRTENIEVLAESIRVDGLLQPIVVRKHPDEKAKTPWMIVAGERRWEAHRLLKREEIEARVRPETLADGTLDAVRKRHAENFHREDLSPIQKARGLQELFDLKMPQAEIAAFIGAKDQSTVSNFCRLLRLPEDVQQMVHRGELTAAHAKALLRWEKWPRVCACIARNVAADGMSSKELEAEEGLPYVRELLKARLVVEFSTWQYSDDHFDETPEMKKDPDYVLTDHYRKFCLNLEKWEKEKARQLPLIAERKKKQAAAEKAQAASRCGGGMTAKEKKERQEKVARNKARREATASTFADSLLVLKSTKGVNSTALAVICDRVLGEGDVVDLNEAAASIGLKLPEKVARANVGYGGGVEVLRGLAPEMLIKLTAAAIVQTECDQALKFSSETPEVALAIAGKKKVGGATSVQVSVTLGNDNKARAGSATASCTSSPEGAARKAAGKFFGCDEKLIALELTSAGSTSGAVPSLYIATKKGGRK